MQTAKEEEIIALQNLKNLLELDSAQIFFKFLLKEFDVLGSPPPLLNEKQMIEEVAYRRMGGTIVDYISKSNPLVFGKLMAQLAKENHDDYLEANTIEDESE